MGDATGGCGRRTPVERPRHLRRHPSRPGTASAGGDEASRADHVHALPTIPRCRAPHRSPSARRRRACRRTRRERIMCTRLRHAPRTAPASRGGCSSTPRRPSTTAPAGRVRPLVRGAAGQQSPVPVGRCPYTGGLAAGGAEGGRLRWTRGGQSPLIKALTYASPSPFSSGSARTTPAGRQQGPAGVSASIPTRQARLCRGRGCASGGGRARVVRLLAHHDRRGAASWRPTTPPTAWSLIDGSSGVCRRCGRDHMGVRSWTIGVNNPARASRSRRPSTASSATYACDACSPQLRCRGLPGRDRVRAVTRPTTGDPYTCTFDGIAVRSSWGPRRDPRAHHLRPPGLPPRRGVLPGRGRHRVGAFRAQLERQRDEIHDLRGEVRTSSPRPSTTSPRPAIVADRHEREHP